MCYCLPIGQFRGAGANGDRGGNCLLLPLWHGESAGAENCPFAMKLELDLLSLVHLHNVN